MSGAAASLPAYTRIHRVAGQSWKLAGGFSVRTKILGIVLALTIALGLSATWQVRTVMEHVFITELDTRGLSVASDLSARSVDPILLNDTLALYQLLTETVENHPDALYAFVANGDGQVLAHTFGDAGFPTALVDYSLISEAVPDSGSGIHRLRYTSNEGTVHEFIAPIFPGRSESVRLGLTENRLSGIVNTVTGQMLFTTLMVAVAGIGAAMLLTWLLTRPILDLVSTTRQVGRGDMGARAPHWADDEIGDLADAFNQMVTELEASHQKVAEKEAARAQLLRKLIYAQEEERRRIARDLHDSVGQSLTSLMVGLKLLNQDHSPEEMNQHISELRNVASETLEEVRLLSRQLRPSVLDDLGLAAALERFTADIVERYPGLTIDLHSDLPTRLPPLVETTLYRIVQEAMTNAARHSGGSTISVLLTQRDSRVLAIIEDDGRGFNPDAARSAGSSVGLHSMTERAELLNGDLTIESSGDGTTVFVEVPT